MSATAEFDGSESNSIRRAAMRASARRVWQYVLPMVSYSSIRSFNDKTPQSRETLRRRREAEQRAQRRGAWKTCSEVAQRKAPPTRRAAQEAFYLRRVITTIAVQHCS